MFPLFCLSYGTVTQGHINNTWTGLTYTTTCNFSKKGSDLLGLFSGKQLSIGLYSQSHNMHLHTFPMTPYDITSLICTSINISMLSICKDQMFVSKHILSYQFGLPIGWCGLEVLPSACSYPVLVLLNALVSYSDLWEAIVNSQTVWSFKSYISNSGPDRRYCTWLVCL